MIIRCLGVVGAVYEGELTAVSPAQRRILGILTAAGPDGLDSASFADELWVDDLPGDWESAVRMAMSRLRRALPAGTIERAGGRYRLALASQEVDVWALLEAPTQAIVDDAVARQRLAGQAYAGLDPSPLLRTSGEAIAAARVRLIDWMTTLPTSWSQPTLQAAQALARQQLHRQEMVRSVARLHIACGATGLGRSLLQEGIDYQRDDLGVEPDEHTTSLLRGIADEPVELAAPEPLSIGTLIRPGPEWIDRARLADELNGRLNQHGALLTGEPGSGKTVAANSLALDRLDRSHHVVRIAGRRDAGEVYGPFLSIDESVTSALSPLLDDGGSAFAQSKSWLAVLIALQQNLPDLPILLVIDDAQWLDSHSRRLVEFLAAAQSTSRVVLLVVGRDDSLAPAWRDFSANLLRSGLQKVIAGSFSSAELVELVGQKFPRSSSKQRVDMAAQLERVRATTPAVATELVRRADGQTLVLPPVRADDLTVGAWTDDISEHTHAIGSVAAVIGMVFRIDEVAALGSFETADLYQAIDELLDANLVLAEQRPDEFSFRHVLIHRAFEGWLNRSEMRSLHLDAAQLAGVDIHRKSMHLHAAGALSDRARTIAALVASAQKHRDGGSFSESVAAFAMADSYGVSALMAQQLRDYADALDSSGADGWQIRERAFALAIAHSDSELAVQVAVSNALETEDVTGDSRRAHMLRRIPAGELSAAAMATRDVTLARELGLLGEHDEALALAAMCAERATGPDQATRAWLGAWPSIITRPVGLWPSLPSGTDNLNDPELRSRVAQTMTLQSLLSGRTQEARAHLEVFQRLPFTTENGLRSWYAILLESLVSFNDGEWKRASAQAEQAMAYGQRLGIADAFSVRAAQLFAQHWVAGTHGELLPLLDLAPPDVGSSLLAEAAYAVALAEAPPRIDDAQKIVDRLVAQLLCVTTPFSVAAAGLITSAPPQVLEPHRDDLRSIVQPFSGTHVVVGMGIVSLGPASRTLAGLATEPDQRVSLMRSAVGEADEWGLRAWSVRCRLDLAKLTGDADLLSEAKSIATPDLSDHLFAARP